MPSYAFDTSVINLVKSVYSVEEFSERIVRGAVIDTITSISERYGLHADELKRELVEGLVSKHAHMTAAVPPRCQAITYRGKRCTHEALVDGKCLMHSQQDIKETIKTTKTVSKKRSRSDVDKVTWLLTSVKQRMEEGR
jgi:hypothetical protein